MLAVAGFLRFEDDRGLALALLGSAVALVLLDVVIDFWLADPTTSPSDARDLNVRGSQLVGRTATVDEAFVGGRGKVRVGDTVWIAEGPDCPAGASVKVVGAKGPVLRVERA